MKRKIIYSLVTLVIVFLGVFLGLFFHELGHYSMAVLFGLPVEEFHIGVLSYVSVDVKNASNIQLALVSIGSIIIPEIIYLTLLISKNAFVTMFRICTGMNLYVNCIFNAVILIIGTSKPEMWDVVLFQQYSGIETWLVIAGLVLIVTINIILESVRGGVKNIFSSFEKIVSSD